MSNATIAPEQPEFFTNVTAVYYGCFKGSNSMSPQRHSYSTQAACTRSCLRQGYESSYFSIVSIDERGQRECGCSEGCSLVLSGATFERTSDKNCFTLISNTSNFLAGAMDPSAPYHAVYSLSDNPTTTCSEYDMTLPQNAPVLYLSYSVLSVNILLLLAVVAFIAGPETHASDKKLSLKILASPFNVQLILISLSLIGVFSCLIVKSTHLFETTTNYLSALQILFSAVFKSCFLFYSWGRGSSVIESVWPKATRTFQIIIKLHPILIFAPVIPSILFIVSMSQPIGSTGNLPETSRVAMRVLDLTSIISVLVADLALLVCFMLYIRRNTRISETDKVAPRFLKICYYGTLANVFCIAAFFTFLVRYVTTDGLSHSPVGDYTSDAIVHSFFTAVFAALFALKIVLHFDSVNEGKRKREAINHAKAVSLGHSTSSGARVVSQDQATITASKNRDTRIV